jgi:mycothiol synthase
VVSQRHINRLKMEQVDWDLVEKWRQEGTERAAGVSIELFQDVPEKDIEQYCQLYSDVSNQAPAGDLAGPQIVTPEKRRLTEKEFRDVGYIWHTLISRETDGAISGMTEITYTPQQPHLIEQELTGVRPAYRGRGLGKWLKAAMLFFARDEYPHAKFVDTGNADHNAPMLAINERMGFENLLSQTFFEFEMGDLSKLGS